MGWAAAAWGAASLRAQIAGPRPRLPLRTRRTVKTCVLRFQTLAVSPARISRMWLHGECFITMRPETCNCCAAVVRHQHLRLFAPCSAAALCWRLGSRARAERI
eukprot:122713-Rhodomonas_salina.1